MLRILKLFGAIVISIIAIALVVVCGFYIWQKTILKNIEHDSQQQITALQNQVIQPQSSAQQSLKDFFVPNEWKEVNHTNFWGHPDLFATPDYKFPNIKFSYPANWKFGCCNDMGHGSGHIIFSSQDYDKMLPYIIIMDYVLFGCPDWNKSCGLLENIIKSPKEKFDDLTKQIPNDAQIGSKLALNNLDTDAFVYKTTDKNGRSIKSFIINTTDGVVEISFVNYPLLGG